MRAVLVSGSCPVAGFGIIDVDLVILPESCIKNSRTLKENMSE
jgi:hypothetical protein